MRQKRGGESLWRRSAAVGGAGRRLVPSCPIGRICPPGEEPATLCGSKNPKRGGDVQQRTPAEVLRLVQDEGVEIVDFRFIDLPGLTQHFSVPAHALGENVFEEGIGFDGSSIRGFQEIQESDMLLFPDPNTAVLAPFRQHKTLNLNCFVRDPITLESYSRDPRYIAQKAEAYLKTTGIAD